MAYNRIDVNNFKTAENENKIIRIMYKGDSGIYDYLDYYKCISSNGNYTLEKISNEEIVTNETQEILPDEDTGLKKVIILKPENLKSEYIKKDIDIANISGSFIGNAETYDLNSLNFQNGPMSITPSEDHLFDRVNISRPINLYPENIRSGVVIAGITGTYESDDMPVLNAPTGITDITNRQSESSYGYIRVTIPSTNGNFAKECQLFIEKSVTQEDGTTSTEDYIAARKSIDGLVNYIDFYATDWIDDFVTKQKVLKAQFLNSKFSPSPKYSVSKVTDSNTNSGAYAITKMNYDIQNLQLSKSPPKIYWGQYLYTQLTPNEGFYLPKKIEVLSNMSEISPVEKETGGVSYDSTTGKIIIKYGRFGESIQATYTDILNIKAIAADKPWLPDFSINDVTLNESQLTIDGTKISLDAQRIDLKLNGQIIKSIPLQSVNTKFTVENISSPYGFTKQSDGYYQSTNKNQHSSVALARVTIENDQTVQYKIYYRTYGENNFDYGIISMVDKTLLNNNSGETSNVLFNGKSKSSSNILTSLVDIPEGKHTIDFKYIKDSSGHKYDDNFRFKLEPQITKLNVNIDLSDIPELQKAGTYDIEITAEADGYTGTDPVIIQYVKEFSASVEGETLLLSAGEVINETFIAENATENNETLTYTI